MPRARFLLGFAALAACSLATDLSDLAGDGGSDVTTPDAPIDASVDAPFDVAPIDGGCPDHPNAYVCDFFDDVPLLQGWTSDTVTSGATLAISDAQSSSPPSSLLSEMSFDAQTFPSASSSLEWIGGVAFTKVRSSFDVYIDSAGEHAAAIGGVYLKDGPKMYGLTVFAHATTTAIFEDGSGDLPDGDSTSIAHFFTPPIQLQQWTRVILDVDFVGSDAGGPSYTLTIQSPPDVPATPSAPTPIGVTLPTAPSSVVVAGINWQTPLSVTAPWRVYVDDVIVEPLPN